jgi:hypothetical protein
MRPSHTAQSQKNALRFVKAAQGPRKFFSVKVADDFF